MTEAFIVVKKTPVSVEGRMIDFSTNEAVFATENEANGYIRKRKALKDRDDRGSHFSVEPWLVQRFTEE